MVVWAVDLRFPIDSLGSNFVAHGSLLDMDNYPYCAVQACYWLVLASQYQLVPARSDFEASALASRSSCRALLTAGGHRLAACPPAKGCPSDLPSRRLEFPRFSARIPTPKERLKEVLKNL